MLILSGPSAVKASWGAREPIAEDGYWLVYRATNGKTAVIDSGNRMSQVELKAEKFKERYTVKQERVPFKHKDEYSSQDPGRFFTLSVDMNVIVDNPVRIVEHEIHSLHNSVDADVSFWLDHMAGEYLIEDFNKLKSDIRKPDFLSRLKDDLKAKGFAAESLQITVALSQDDMEYFKKVEDIKRKRMLAALQEEDREKEMAKILKLREEANQDALILAVEENSKAAIDRLLRMDKEKKEFEEAKVKAEREREDAKERERYERAKEDQKRLDDQNAQARELMVKFLQPQMDKNIMEADDLVKVLRTVNSVGSPGYPELENPKMENSLPWGSNSNQNAIDVADEDVKESSSSSWKS